MKTRIVEKTVQKTVKVLACLGITLTCATSCGILGDKKEASRSLAQEGGACLDELGPLTNAFLDGTVSEAKWRATWDCVDDTIDLFKKFVKGSETEGYLPEDLRFLMQRFLFSKGTVSPRLVDGALALKASLFGGTKDRLTKAELDNFRALARFLKEESVVLMPHLRNRVTSPTATNLRALSVAIETFGIHLADYLNTTSNSKWTIDQAIALTTELASMSFTTSPQAMEQWTRFGQELKTLVVRGATDGIAGADWTKILKVGFRATGAVTAYLSTTENDPLFQIEMVNKIQTVLNGAIAEWGTELPFSQFEKIITAAPSALLPALEADFRIGARSILRERVVSANGATTRFRPALAHLLQTRTDTGIDAAAIERLIGSYRAAMRGNLHLKVIFGSQKEDLTAATFSSRALGYSLTLPNTNDRADVSRLITIANRYPGLHPSNSPEILFLDQNKHSLNNLERMNWYELAATTLLQAYASSTNSFGKAATLVDLSTLIDDLSLFLYPFHMTHPLKPNVGAKRFREANLFMPNGNGDDLMDLPETTNYLAYIFSAGRQNSRITDATIEGANPCPIIAWNIPLKMPAYEVQCFRNRLAANFHDLYSNLPRLEDELAGMTTSERATWDQTLEAASKNTGYNQDPITGFDLSSYAGLPHYAESVMLRFDTNHDGALDRGETLNNVFPIFKRELAGISKIKIDFLNKAVLLYLMQNGKQPEIKDLLGWAISFQFLKDFKARRIRIYQIFAALSPPAPADPMSTTPPAGVFGSSSLGVVAQNFVYGLTAPSLTTTSASTVPFDLSSVDPTQLQGYSAGGPVIDPSSPYQEALVVLPQDL